MGRGGGVGLKHNFYERIHNNPVIAAVNDPAKLDSAIQSPADMIFLLGGNIFNLEEMVARVKEAQMGVYVHLDLLEGFSRDAMAMRYIGERVKPHGIITTKSSLIKIAKGMDIFAIQRIFVLDSLSLETAVKSIGTNKPDAVEILPGIMPKIIRKIRQETRTTVIAGGLINDKEDVVESLKAGADAVSSSKEAIWFV